MTACDASEVCDGNRFISWTETMREMASRRDGATSVAVGRALATTPPVNSACVDASNAMM